MTTYAHGPRNRTIKTYKYLDFLLYCFNFNVDWTNNSKETQSWLWQ